MELIEEQWKSMKLERQAGKLLDQKCAWALFLWEVFSQESLVFDLVAIID